MCGIGALYSPTRALDPEWLRSMQQAVRHRGPDDEGLVLFHGPDAEPLPLGGPDTPADAYSSSLPYAPSREPTAAPAHLALCHRRLSILDLSVAGHQPMCSPDRACWVVHNGEIYNYIELREELMALGHAFATQTDTEVILAAYRAWGRDCLARLNGMFAFVLFDRDRGRLLAARDRFGVKPLYYWIAPDGQLALASEIKQFSVLPGWRPKVNGQRAYDFLNWAVKDHTDETLFEGVFQLRGGEALEFDLRAGGTGAAAGGGRLKTRRWYELKPRPWSGSLEDAGRELRSLFTDSVRLRLRADVPVGSCLSGGLDSSSIVCALNALLRAQDAQALQKTFSACSTVKRFDERDYIDEVVRQTGTDGHYAYPRFDELLPALDRITWHHDEPFGSTSMYAQWRVFELAAGARVKVMLDGQGADEQLAGYPNYFGTRFGGLLRRWRWMALWREIRAAQQLHGFTVAWGLYQTLKDVLPEAVRQSLRQIAGVPSLYAPWLDLERLAAVPADPYVPGRAASSDPIRLLSHAQIVATSLPMLLHAEDRDSMAHSIEARVPFLDYRLVEFVLGLPDEFKLSEGLTKRVLREAMRGVLPEAVRNRVDKMGFVTPEEVWMREENPDWFRTALAEAMEQARGALKPDIAGLLERMIAGRAAFSFLIWRCISFGRWLKVFGAVI